MTKEAASIRRAANWAEAMKRVSLHCACARKARLPMRFDRLGSGTER